VLIERIVRRTLGIKNHVVKGVMGDEEGLVIELDVRKRRRVPCGTCGHRCRVRDRLKEREWKHVPLWGIPTKLRYRPARVRCDTCGKVRVEEIPWGQGKCRLSRGLIGLVSMWTKLLAWDVVARLLGVHWNTVAAAVRQSVAYGRARQQLGSIVYIVPVAESFF
jgi:transposase